MYNAMYKQNVKVEITEVCLKNGYNSRIDFYAETVEDAVFKVIEMLEDLNIDTAKFYSRHRSVEKGTLAGVKLFWNPAPGIRHYLFIKIYEEKRLA
jgi:hypothetical protein